MEEMTKLITVRVAPSEMRQVKEWCEENRVTASDMVRCLFGLQPLGKIPDRKTRGT